MSQRNLHISMASARSDSPASEKSALIELHGDELLHAVQGGLTSTQASSNFGFMAKRAMVSYEGDYPKPPK